jgi:outer membrane protein assembly factor BamD
MLQNTISIRFLLLLLFIVMVSSCSQYEKLLKSDDFQLKYDVAMEYYAKGDYVRSATLIEQILPVYRGTQRAAELSFTLASCYYHRGDYIMAAHYFDNFVREYPNSEHVQEASYLRAYSNYLLSPRPSLDQSATHRAIDQFRLFITRYPTSEKVEEAQKLIDEMRAKLLEKSFQSARLYYDMGDYNSAIIALKNSLIDFPETRHREEIMFLILKSSFLLADNSVPDRQLERFQSTLDEYYTFIEEYPESRYMDEARRFFNNSLRVLDNYPIDDLNELTLDNN